MRERTRSDGETKMVNIGNEWDNLLADQFQSEYYRKLRAFLVDEYNRYNVYPPADCIFNALKYTPYSKVKAVLLGQDPYHGAGQAHGLCFSVKRGVMPPPSLKNIFTEIHSDLGIDFDMSVGELTDWARQGVLMLNTSLTVREGMAGSHRGKGWEILTDRIIELLNERDVPTASYGETTQSPKCLLSQTRSTQFSQRRIRVRCLLITDFSVAVIFQR